MSNKIKIFLGLAMIFLIFDSAEAQQRRMFPFCNYPSYRSDRQISAIEMRRESLPPQNCEYLETYRINAVPDGAMDRASIACRRLVEARREYSCWEAGLGHSIFLNLSNVTASFFYCYGCVR